MDKFTLRFFTLVSCLYAIGMSTANAVNVEYLWDKTDEIPQLNQFRVVNTVTLKEAIPSKAKLFSIKTATKKSFYEYRLRDAIVDSEGVTHARYDEFYKSLPVLWADTIVHRKVSQSINGTFVTEIEKDLTSIKPKLTTKQAIQIAERDYKRQFAPINSAAQPKLVVSELVIYPYAKGKQSNLVAHLAYQVNYYITGQNNKLSNPNYIIDAHTGTVLNYFDNLRRIQSAVGTGPGGNTNPFVTNNTYNYGVGGAPLLGALLIQPDTPTAGQCTWGNNQVAAVSLGNATNNPSIFPIIQTDEVDFPTVVILGCNSGNNHANPNDNGEAPTNGGNSPDNDIIYYGTQTYNLLTQMSGRANPFGNNNPAIRYYVHINSTDAFALPAACSSPDACYNQQAAFGNGQTQYFPQVAYDVVGHETAHIYISRTSNLIYANQSGGMNEAFADITGAALGAYIGSAYPFFPPVSSRVTPSFWAHGALDSKTTPALRYLFNPPLDGHSIDNAAYFTQGMDVHYSSGVYNKAFFVMSSLFGNNYPAVLRAYKYMVTANDTCWTSNMDFFQGSCCVMLAAKNNRQDSINIRTAFNSVGVHCMRSLNKLSVME